MARFGVALLCLLALQNEVAGFGVTKQPSVFGGFSSSTQLHAEGSEILMPALSSTMKEGKVVSWLKSEGDEIEAGELLIYPNPAKNQLTPGMNLFKIPQT